MALLQPTETTTQAEQARSIGITNPYAQYQFSSAPRMTQAAGGWRPDTSHLGLRRNIQQPEPRMTARNPRIASNAPFAPQQPTSPYAATPEPHTPQPGNLKLITAAYEPLPTFNLPPDDPKAHHVPVPDIFTKYDLKVIGLTPFERKLVESKGITLQQAQAIEERIEMMRDHDHSPGHHKKHLHDLWTAVHAARLPEDAASPNPVHAGFTTPIAGPQHGMHGPRPT